MKLFSQVANFQEHLQQAKRNLFFLSRINKEIIDCTDWQVTTCFYSCLHLLNAYLAQEQNLHYNSHRDMEQALNWANATSIVKLSENDFTNYQMLRNLSRRSRYLCTDTGNHSGPAEVTRDKQLAKSIKALDKVIHFFISKYPSEKIEPIEVDCPSLIGEQLRYFQIQKVSGSI